MERTLLDFDAAWAQETDPPLEVRVLGRDYTLPSSMPAGLRLHMWRVRMTQGADAPLGYGDLEAAARFLFGADTVDEWLAERLTDVQLTDVVLSTIAAYSAHEVKSRAEGNAPGASVPPPT